MKRSLGLAAALLTSVALVGCSSLNPFGSSKAERATAATAAEPAKAQRAPDSAQLARFDGNGDGTVATAELETGLVADFKREDTNGDEALDVVETRLLNDRIRKEQSSSPVFDWNADGQIVFTEFASQWRTLFQRSDIDRDGVVDQKELMGARHETTPRPLPKPTFSGKDGRPPGSP